MAAFNPEIPDTGVPNRLGASQGTGPNKTFDAIFSGLVQTAADVTQIKDQTTQAAIRSEAEGVFNSVNAEFGLDAPTPTGLQDDLDRMVTLQAAVEQGKISQVNYYGRLATLSKQLRSKYPRYEQIVDQTIQSVTGTRPANAYRDAIFQELSDIQASASSEEKFKRQWEKENEGVLAALYPDYFENPGKYNPDKVRADVARFKGKKELIDSETQELGLMAKRGEYNDVRAAKQIDRDFSFIVESSLTKVIGLNDPNISSQIDQFVAKGGGTPEELNTFITQISELESTLRSELTMRGRREYVSSGLVPTEKMNSAVEAALYPVTKMKEAILGKDYKAAARYATINKAIQDQQMGAMLENPTFRAGVGLEEVSKTLADDFWDAEKMNEVNTLATEIAGQAIAGRSDIVQKTVDEGNQPVTRKVIDTSFKIITESNLTGEKFSNLINQYFGPNAKDFMSPKVVNPQDLEKLYLDFLNPSVTRAIVERGSAEDLQTYTKWAMEKALSIPAFRAAAGDLNTVGGLGNLSVEFDEKSMRLKIDTGQSPDSPLSRLQQAGFQPYGRALNAVNRVFSVLKPIIEANGENGLDIAKQLISDFNIRLEGGQDGFWKKVRDALDETEGEGEDLGEIEGTFFLPEVTDTGDGVLDFAGQPIARTDQSLAAASGATPQERGRGLEALAPNGLVTSSARGYNPDTKNLKPELASGIRDLQSAWGRPLPIVSGYRDPERNKKAGGAKRSQHMHGNAVDIDVRDLSIAERQDLIRLAKKKGFKGVGVYKNSLHLDKGGERAWGPNFSHTSLPSWARSALAG